MRQNWQFARKDVQELAARLHRDILPRLQDHKVKTRAAIERAMGVEMTNRGDKARLTLAMDYLGFDPFGRTNGCVSAWI